ncbi:MAG: xanthine dehydrogenase family protein subunit M [Thermomicrobiales bacterium]
MIPGQFSYHAPASLSEAIALLGEYGGDAKILSGGQSLIPMMRFRLAQPGHVVDINRIDGLSYVEEANGVLRIGALAREADLDATPAVHTRYPLLADAIGVIADPLVRNLATVCGNVAHADPANDHPAVMLAYRAEVVAEGPGGRRTIPIDDFFVDTFVTSLEPDEVLVELRIPASGPHTGGAYQKLERKVGDYAIAAVAVQLRLNEDGTVAEAGIALTNLGPMPIRAAAAEAALIGQVANAAVIQRAADLTAAAAEPVADNRGPEDYKRAVTRTLAKRAIQSAADRARGA